MSIWLIIIGMAIVTYLPRVLPLLTFHDNLLSPRIKRALSYVPLAVLTAIIAPEFIASEDWFHFRLDEHFIAGIGAIVAAYITHNTFATIFVGMLLLLLLG